MPVITLAQALLDVGGIVTSAGAGSIVTALVSAKNNKGNYFLQGFKQQFEQQLAATAAATSAASACAEKLAQRDQTIADRDRTISQITADRDKTIEQLKDDHDQEERQWKERLYAAEEKCHGYRLRLIDAGLLKRDAIFIETPRPAALLEATPCPQPES